MPVTPSDLTHQSLSCPTVQGGASEPGCGWTLGVVGSQGGEDSVALPKPQQRPGRPPLPHAHLSISSSPPEQGRSELARGVVCEWQSEAPCWAPLLFNHSPLLSLPPLRHRGEAETRAE